MVAVLGAGTMARAVVLGLIETPDIETAAIRTTNRSRSGAARWAESPRVEALAVEDRPDANRVAVAGADLILIGVEPPDVRPLLREIAEYVGPQAIVVSLAAGVSLAAMAALLPPGTTIVRTAPNTPSLVRSGVTGVAMTGGDEHAHEVVDRLFAVLGVVVWVEEDVLPVIGSFSGSGPAYLYFVIEQFARAAEGHGIDAERAGQLAAATFVGAAALLEATGLPPADLRRQVTTPGGATSKAIGVLDGARLDEVFQVAIGAAVARIHEMGAAD